jgi:hypothetical protein
VGNREAKVGKTLRSFSSAFHHRDTEGAENAEKKLYEKYGFLA